MDGESLNVVVADDLDVVDVKNVADLELLVPPSRSSLTYRDMLSKHVRYMTRPDASNPTCSNNDLASVTSSYRA